MGYQTIEVRKLTPHIGAEIFGVDLAKPLGNQAFQEIHDALMANLVIFFRDQELTHEQHKAFGRRFGELHMHPTSTRNDGSIRRSWSSRPTRTPSTWPARNGTPTSVAIPSRRWAASST